MFLNRKHSSYGLMLFILKSFLFLKLVDADFVFGLISAFPQRLCLSSKGQVRTTIALYENSETDVAAVPIKFEENRAESAHIRRFEKAANQLLSLVREGKVRKSAVRRSIAYQELAKVLRRKHRPQVQRTHRNRTIRRVPYHTVLHRTKRTIRTVQPTPDEDVEVMMEVMSDVPDDVSDDVPETVSSNNESFNPKVVTQRMVDVQQLNLGSVLDVRGDSMDLEEDFVPDLNLSSTPDT